LCPLQLRKPQAASDLSLTTALFKMSTSLLDQILATLVDIYFHTIFSVFTQTILQQSIFGNQCIFLSILTYFDYVRILCELNVFSQKLKIWHVLHY